MFTQISNFWHEWAWIIAMGWGFGLFLLWFFFEGVNKNNKED